MAREPHEPYIPPHKTLYTHNPIYPLNFPKTLYTPYPVYIVYIYTRYTLLVTSEFPKGTTFSKNFPACGRQEFQRVLPLQFLGGQLADLSGFLGVRIHPNWPT